MEFSEVFKSLIGLFSGGLSGAVSNLVLLVAAAIASWKISGFLKKKIFQSSKKQASDDRANVVSENQSSDVAQHAAEQSVDSWRKEVRDGHSQSGDESSRDR